MGTDSLSLDPEKLRGSERSKVEIRQIANEVLNDPSVKDVGYVAQLWKVVTVNGVEESREVFNKSTYKASPKIVNVGTASEDPNASATIGAALATGDE